MCKWEGGGRENGCDVVYDTAVVMDGCLCDLLKPYVLLCALRMLLCLVRGRLLCGTATFICLPLNQSCCDWLSNNRRF